MSNPAAPSAVAVARPPHVVIRPRRGWQLINTAELIAYRDLFYFLIWRDIKVRYAQSILGFGWAIIQPVFQSGIFTVIFGGVAGIEAPYGWPYLLFSFCATVPWTFFSNAVTESSASLVTNAQMITKVYFPRLILPVTSVLGKLVDFAVGLGLLVILLSIYRWAPNRNVVVLPLLIVLMVMSASGLGMWLTALSIQYRDVRYAMGFAVNLLMWASPVVYPTADIAERFPKLVYVYALNPMVGVIEGFRSALLGGQPMPWDLIGISAAVATFLIVSGAFYFRRMERVFADVA